ncbi:MAG: DNA-binding protein [Meiothermus sp.]
MRLVTVFGSSRTAPGTSAYEEARTWGRAVAEAGFGAVTGGYSGSMEAVSYGAKEAGGTVLGVTAPSLFPNRAGANEHVGLELPASTLLVRIERLLDLAQAYVVLPGGIGTLTELMAAWNVAFIERMYSRPFKPIAVHSAWMGVLEALHQTPGLEMPPSNLELLTPVANVDELKVFLSQLPNKNPPSTSREGYG